MHISKQGKNSKNIFVLAPVCGVCLLIGARTSHICTFSFMHFSGLRALGMSHARSIWMHKIAVNIE